MILFSFQTNIYAFPVHLLQWFALCRLVKKKVDYIVITMHDKDGLAFKQAPRL